MSESDASWEGDREEVKDIQRDNGADESRQSQGEGFERGGRRTEGKEV